jgi:hypothetical protein
VPPPAYDLTHKQELAGIGGDVFFVKLGFQGSYARSFRRYHPDTGYELPLSRGAFYAAQKHNEKAKGSGGPARVAPEAGVALGAAAPAPTQPQAPQPSSGGARGALQAHPGASMFGKWARILGADNTLPQPGYAHIDTDAIAAAAGLTVRKAGVPAVAAASPAAVRKTSTAAAAASAPTYTWGHRLAGWLSPGVTTIADVTGGVLVPFGDDAARPAGGRIIDRFFMLGAKFRGFDSIGPTAAPVVASRPVGDVLGGDYLAAATLRVLLPPPVPSVRLANIGLRTQLWATAGALAARGDTPSLASFAEQWRGSVGVGLFLPLVNGIALEANYALVHKAQARDAVATLRLQLGA